MRIERRSESPLEAGRGSLSLTCITSSNPPGRTMWWRQGQAGAPQYREQLVFDPVTREQAGDYVCAAENSVGRSEEARASVEVLCKSHISHHASSVSPSFPPPFFPPSLSVKTCQIYCQLPSAYICYFQTALSGYRRPPCLRCGPGSTTRPASTAQPRRCPLPPTSGCRRCRAQGR